MKPKWPREITSGSVTVKVYEVAHPTNKSGKAYVLAHVTPTGRKTQKFADPDDALREARLKASQLASGRIEGADMSRADRDELQAARALAGDVPVLAALQEWAKVRDLTAGHVIAAGELWASRNTGKHKRAKVADVVKEFLAAKKAAGVQTEDNHGGLFKEVVADFGTLHLDTISAAQLSAWLGKKLHPGTRNTYRKHCVSLWRWAQRQNYLSREIRTEAENTDRAKEAPHEIGIFGVQTLRDLLAHFRKHHPEYLGPLVLACFCGLRRSEIHNQKWADVELARKFVRVSSAKKGTPSRRLVPLSDAAVSWLMLCPDRTHDLSANLAIDRIRDIARGAGFNLPENSFRHSFISHRVAQTGNVAETALEAGNSPTIIFQHYRELVEKQDGEAWFSVTP